MIATGAWRWWRQVRDMIAPPTRWIRSTWMVSVLTRLSFTLPCKHTIAVVLLNSTSNYMSLITSNCQLPYLLDDFFLENSIDFNYILYWFPHIDVWRSNWKICWVKWRFNSAKFSKRFRLQIQRRKLACISTPLWWYFHEFVSRIAVVRNQLSTSWYKRLYSLHFLSPTFDYIKLTINTYAFILNKWFQQTLL